MELTPDREALINRLLDFIMANVQENVVTLKNYQRVPIHDLVKHLELDLALSTLRASLKACKGTLSDLTTIRRVGDVAISSEEGGKTIYIALKITLDKLELCFDKYTLQVSLVKISGDKLKLNIKKNLIDLLLVIRFNGLEVEMYFDKFKLLHFDDIDVDITGFGVLNPVACKVADWIVDNYNDFVVREVAEPYAKKLFNSAINDRDFLRRLFGYAISGMVRGASSNINKPPESSSNSEEPQVAVVTSEDHEHRPVAPVRQRRINNSTHREDRRNNLVSQPNGPVISRPSVPRRNNINLQTAVSQEGKKPKSVSPRVSHGVAKRNNLAPARNEIYLEHGIQKPSMFSARSREVVEVDDILPLKPPML